MQAPVLTPESPDSLTFDTSNGPLLLQNPYRGTLLVAGPNSTAPLAIPLIEQFAQRNFAGLVYTTGPLSTVAAAAQGLPRTTAVALNEKPVRLRTLNFLDLTHSEKVNPLAPANIPTVADAMECAAALVRHSEKNGGDFFLWTGQAYLSGIIWYFCIVHPDLCTVPHVLAMALQDDFKAVLALLDTVPACRKIVQSLLTAVEQGADKQIAGVVAMLQLELGKLATPEASWLLNPDPAKGEGFSLDLNDPNDPALLTLTSGSKFTAPLASCVISVALRLMNQRQKQRSYVLLDELETVFVPRAASAPATARSNKLAIICTTQDMAKLTAVYGEAQAECLAACLNNQFFGKPQSNADVDLLLKMFKYPDFVYAQPLPNPLKRIYLAIIGQSAKPKLSEASVLRKRQFMGQIAGNPRAVFKAFLAPATAPARPAAAGLDSPALTAVFQAAIEENHQRICRQVEEVLHPASGGESAPLPELV